MKKLILVFTILAMVFNAQARHSKVGELIAAGVGGALIGGIIFNDHRPCAPVYYTSPQVVYAQPQVVYIQQPPTPQVIVSNSVQPQTQVTVVDSQNPQIVKMTTVVKYVWIEGHYITTYGSDGSIIRTWVPGRYETKAVEVPEEIKG